jgi:hypothetical protein
MTHKTSTAATPLTQTNWFKSSFSSPSQSCVEVRFDGAVVHIRDSKYRRDPSHDLTQEPIISVTVEQWDVLLDELVGRTQTGANRALSVEILADQTTCLRATELPTTLRFTKTEWAMFLAGVRAGEFQAPALAARAR